nr:crocetin glucosyltransferase, chloroplastic-like [Tanacetum cinerariifolium]
MTMSQSYPHILLVCQSVQGHLNPSFQLANNLICAGARVTLATPVSGFHKLKSLPSIHGLSFASFTDGHDENSNAFWNPGYAYDIERFGSESIATLVKTMSERGNNVNLLVYTLYLPFVAHVARDLNVPSALFLIQSATCFSIYNHFCNPCDGNINTSVTLKLPGLPLFKWNDLPTFVLPTFPRYSDMCYVYQDHMNVLEKDPNACVLVNTLDGLEPDSMKSIKNSIVVGPLVSSTFSDNKVSCSEWLDSKKENSVVYVSFGSLAVLTKTQKVELLHGLMKTQLPFLLVLRDVDEDEDVEIKQLKEKVSEYGLIVGWCAQLEVLKHRAIGCFVTHCGWNSTLESLVAGVAIVGCPQFSDQTTNAKMVEEVWGNGVRAVLDEEMVVKRDEIKRCLDVVMGGGERAKEIRKNTEKWRKVATESVKDGGSLRTNLKLVLQNIS